MAHSASASRSAASLTATYYGSLSRMTRTSTQSPSPSEEPDQPCPECSPPSKVGNNRGKCKTCNSYAARVRREASKALAELHPRDYADLTMLAREHEYEKLRANTPARNDPSGQA